MSDKQVLHCMLHVSIDNTDNCSITADCIEPELQVRTILQPLSRKRLKPWGLDVTLVVHVKCECIQLHAVKSL